MTGNFHLTITVPFDRVSNQPISPHSLLGPALEKCFKTRPADQPLPLFILQLLPIACFRCQLPVASLSTIGTEQSAGTFGTIGTSFLKLLPTARCLDHEHVPHDAQHAERWHEGCS
jgi:hypothetical protein